MLLFPKNYEAEETNFPNAWENVVKFCLKEGYKISTEYGNNSLDICSRITLSGHAIYQIKSRKLHPRFPTRDMHLQEYIKQYTSNFDADRFEYTYYDRLTKYEAFDKERLNQLEYIKDNLKTSRRLQATTWMPHVDLGSTEPPCLQLIQIRVLDEPNMDDYIFTKGRVEVFLTWRSRDLYNAWASNLVAIVFLLYNEILGDKYEICKLVDSVSCAHIYESDWERAKQV